MRKIWFRAKDLDGSPHWFYGDLIHDGGESAALYLAEDNSDLAIDPDTVGQFTCFYDRNGKEIYEGDILENIFGAHGEVVFKHGSWQIDYSQFGFN